MRRSHPVPCFSPKATNPQGRTDSALTMQKRQCTPANPHSLRDAVIRFKTRLHIAHTSIRAKYRCHTAPIDRVRKRKPVVSYNARNSASEAGYRAQYRKQLNNPNSMISKILRYVQERPETRFKDLKEVIVHEWGYKISGSIGACLAVLEQDEYIRIKGRGDSKVLRAARSIG